MARPSKYKPEFVEKALAMCLQGATDRELAEFFKVAESTLNLWKLEHSEFSEALKIGKERADERVVQSLYRRAIGYSHDSVHVSNFQGGITLTPIVEHYAPDTVAAIFWLKNRRPAEWRDVKAVEHSGSVTHKHVRELTLDELDRRIAELTGGEAPADAGPKPPSGVH